MCFVDICSLPYGRIDYIRFKGTGLRQTISAFLRPQRCVQFGCIIKVRGTGVKTLLSNGDSAKLDKRKPAVIYFLKI